MRGMVNEGGDVRRVRDVGRPRVGPAVRRAGMALGVVCGLAIAAAGLADDTLRAGDWSLTLPLGLPAAAVEIPDGDPPNAARVVLGRALFFDGRLSRDGTVACAACHDPAHGFADPRPLSRGVGGATSARHAPAAVNRLFSGAQFWDGRAASLEHHSLMPIDSPDEPPEKRPSVIRAHFGPRPSPFKYDVG